MPAVAAALAQAFDTDPFMRHVLPERDYHRRLTHLFAFEAYTTPHGTWVAIDHGRIAGAALWALPGQRSNPLVTLRHLPYLVRALGTALPRAGASFRTVARARPKSPPHWYLQTVGAAWPGRGIGGALLRDGLARVDAAGMPAYLESSALGNVPLYEKFGFRPTGEIVLPDGPTVIPMWREPRG